MEETPSFLKKKKDDWKEQFINVAKSNVILQSMKNKWKTKKSTKLFT